MKSELKAYCFIIWMLHLCGCAQGQKSAQLPSIEGVEFIIGQKVSNSEVISADAEPDNLSIWTSVRYPNHSFNLDSDNRITALYVSFDSQTDFERTKSEITQKLNRAPFLSESESDDEKCTSYSWNTVKFNVGLFMDWCEKENDGVGTIVVTKLQLD